jgi:hypothetical protein
MSDPNNNLDPSENNLNTEDDHSAGLFHSRNSAPESSELEQLPPDGEESPTSRLGESHKAETALDHLDHSVLEENLKKIVEIYAPFYNLHRNQIIHEDTLVNQRLSWLLFPQAALITVYSIKDHVSAPIFFVTYIGLGLTLLSSYGILTAIRAGMDTVKKYEPIQKKIPGDIRKLMPSIVGFPEIITVGWMAPVGFCFAFLVSWGILEFSRHHDYQTKMRVAFAITTILLHWLLVVFAIFTKNPIIDCLIPTKKINQILEYCRIQANHQMSNRELLIISYIIFVLVVLCSDLFTSNATIVLPQYNIDSFWLILSTVGLIILLIFIICRRRIWNFWKKPR